MKTFIAKQEVRDLLNQVIMDEISFTRMVEIMNERVSERVENIPVRKFKKGDKVRIKHGVSSKTHYNVDPDFVDEMDDLIGKTMTVDSYTYYYVECEETEYVFLEEWLEPYEELKKGDLAIFWEENKKYATIRIYDQSNEQSNESEKYVRHKDNIGSNWKNAIKFESKEQYEKLLKGEI